METMTETRSNDLYELTEEQTRLRDMLREFADGEVAPKAARYDEQNEFPWDNVKKMRELGLFGMIFPEEYGGLGLDTLSYVIAVEEISRACASTDSSIDVRFFRNAVIASRPRRASSLNVTIRATWRKSATIRSR